MKFCDLSVGDLFVIVDGSGRSTIYQKTAEDKKKLVHSGPRGLYTSHDPDDPKPEMEVVQVSI